MLHNNGPYGPNDAPMNMGTPVNMSQMSSPMNIGHSLSNLSKIAQQPPPAPSPHYNIPNYTNYAQPPLSLPPQMSPYPSYSPVGFPPSYMPQNTPSLHEPSWQNGMLPMNLNVQANHGHNILNYPSTFNKRPPESTVIERPEPNMYGKNLPINIPQVPTKPFQKLDMDHENNLYNVNHDRFNRYSDYELDWSRKPPERPILDNTRRKSLENTVRLIENILISTTKNKEMERKQEASMAKMSDISQSADIIQPRRIQTTIQPKIYQPTVLCTPEPEPKNEEVIPNIPAVTQFHVQHEKVPENIIINNEKSPETSENNLEEVPEDNNDTDPLLPLEKEHNDQSVSNDDILKDEDDDAMMGYERSSSESEEDIKPVISDLIQLKVENEDRPSIDVKVEQIYWTDTEYLNPFHHDVNGIMIEDVTNGRIVDYETSVDEATAVVKSGLYPESNYECPHCNLLFPNSKRFLIHAKWHSFGLTNDKRMELARVREERRNQRKEARVISRLNDTEVTEECSGKKYQCKDCEKAFTSKGSLKNHRQRVHPTRIRECKICRAKVLGWMALRAHLASHTADTGYQCQDCHKQFKYAHSLAKHRDTHLEKTLACELCPKKFGSNAQLKTHQKVHERARRGATYSCSYCAKGFYEAYNLAVHERTHRNERPYLCDICNTSFGTNSSLKRHLKVSHNSAKPYECSTCHRSFVSESIRDRHAARVHAAPGDFKYNCDECSCKYLKLKDLQKHVYKAHPKGRRRKKAKGGEDSE